MYTEIPCYLSVFFLLGGLFLLTKSADVFVDGSAAIAHRLGINPFIVGMVIIGFGTSAPELCVSVLSGVSGHSDLSLGNAYGSCVFNLAAILGVAALIRPLVVKPSVNAVGVPLLLTITLISFAILQFGNGFSRMDGFILLGIFTVLLPLYCWYDQKSAAEDAPPKAAGEKAPVLDAPARSLARAFAELVIGLFVLIGSSHLLVWGAVDIARSLGVSELMIGLTVVGIGTSLPELASAVASARKGQHEFVLGNIIGSNFFNMLAVVGLAGAISPFQNISTWVVWRDIPAMLVMTLLVTAFGLNWRKPSEKGVICRWEGALWVLCYLAYLGLTIFQESGVAK